MTSIKNQCSKGVSDLNDAIINLENPKAIIGVFSIPVVGLVIQYIKEKNIIKQIENCPADNIAQQIELRDRLIQVKKKELIGNLVQMIFFTALGLAIPFSLFIFIVATFALLNAKKSFEISDEYEQIRGFEYTMKMQEIQNTNDNAVHNYLTYINSVFHPKSY